MRAFKLLEMDDTLLVAITEQRSKSDIDTLVSVLEEAVAEAKPGRLRRITECMTSTIARHTP